MKLPDLLKKTCLIGLTYIDTNGDTLKSAQYAGTVIEVDEEEGIKVKLFKVEGFDESKETPNFHLPPSLDAWYLAPKGHFKDSEHSIDIENPDYFVTWDVVRKKDPNLEEGEEGQQEWWEWHPKTTAPSVN